MPALPTPTGAAVAVDDLTKRYGDVRALDGVNLAVAPGEIFGLLGPNGAGKSTMIRILTGRAKPTSGRAQVLGHEVPRELEPVRAQINLVAETPNLYTRSSARENLELFCKLYGLPRLRAAEVDIIGAKFDELFSILLFVIFVALMVVPMQTAEGIESGTFGALRLAATGPEILGAKALAGYLYGAAGVGLTVVLTGLELPDPLLFCTAVFALIVTLVGFGLLLGLLLPNTSAINAYAAFLIAPLVFLAGAVFTFDSGIAGAILDLLPFSQAVKLLADSISPQQPFGAGPLAWLVIVVWALAGYVVLARIASRREL